MSFVGEPAMQISAQPLHPLRAAAFCALRGVFVLLVLFFSLFARGVMPSFGPEGMTTILCTAEGIQEVWIGPDGEPGDRPVQDEQNAPCEWIMHAQVFDLTAHVTLPLPKDQLVSQPYCPKGIACDPRMVLRAYDSRGPPRSL